MHSTVNVLSATGLHPIRGSFYACRFLLHIKNVKPKQMEEKTTRALGEVTSPGIVAGGLSTVRQTLQCCFRFLHTVQSPCPFFWLLHVIRAEESAVTGSEVRPWGAGGEATTGLTKGQPAEAKSPAPSPHRRLILQAPEGSQL